MSAASPSIIKEVKVRDSFTDDCGGVRHVLGPADAAVRLERKKYAVRALRLPAGGGGVRRTVVRLRRAAAACGGPRGGVLPCAGLGHGRHPSGRLRRHLRRTFKLRRYREEAGNFKGPPLRRVRGHSAVQLLCGVFCAVRLCGVHPAGRCALDAGAGGGASAVRAGRGGVSAGEKHRPCPHLCHGGGSRPRAAGAGRALRHAGRGADCTGRLGAGAGRRLRFCAVLRCCQKTVWRCDR